MYTYVSNTILTVGTVKVNVKAFIRIRSPLSEKV